MKQSHLKCVKKILKWFYNSKFALENFFRSMRIRRNKRGGHTMRRSIFIATNGSSCSFSKSGTTQKYNFQSLKTMKKYEKVRFLRCFWTLGACKNFLLVVYHHNGYLKCSPSVRVSEDINIITGRRTNQFWGSKKLTPPPICTFWNSLL